jgi:hypothetical protein
VPARRRGPRGSTSLPDADALEREVQRRVQNIRDREAAK